MGDGPFDRRWRHGCRFRHDYHLPSRPSLQAGAGSHGKSGEVTARARLGIRSLRQWVSRGAFSAIAATGAEACRRGNVGAAAEELLPGDGARCLVLSAASSVFS